MTVFGQQVTKIVINPPFNKTNIQNHKVAGKTEPKNVVSADTAGKGIKNHAKKPLLIADTSKTKLAVITDTTKANKTKDTTQSPAVAF